MEQVTACPLGQVLCTANHTTDGDGVWYATPFAQQPRDAIGLAGPAGDTQLVGVDEVGLARAGTDAENDLAAGVGLEQALVDGGAVVPATVLHGGHLRIGQMALSVHQTADDLDGGVAVGEAVVPDL